MAIVQISKIQHRTGANVDLPQLDIGEIGFATDDRRLYIGNDPVIHPAANASTTTQTEILTEVSNLDFGKITGTSNGKINLSNVVSGQLIVAKNIANSTNLEWVNAGGNARQPGNYSQYSNVNVHLGDAGSVKLGGGTNGYVLQTDGTGNLTWAAFLTGSVVAGTPGGANSQVQFNDGGTTFGGSSGFTYNQVTGELTNAGNINATAGNIYGNTIGPHTGTIGATTPNTGAFTSITVANNATITGNITGGNANISGRISVTGNANVGNLYSTGLANVGNLRVTSRVQSNLVPSSDETFDLGSSSLKWKDLYLSGTTITLGTQTISANTNGINISGNLYLPTNSINTASINATTLGGTLTTASQPNVTSLGNLSTLTVDGVSYLGPAANVKISGGVNGYVLTTNGLGGLSWQPAIATSTPPGGSNTYIQYNDNGSFGGAPGLTYDPINFLVTVPNLTASGVLQASNVSNVRILGGTNGQFLKTNGSGGLSWATPAGGGGTPGGANGEIQFNDNGAFGANSGLTFNPSTSTLSVANISATIRTSAQPNITSVGNLSSLTVTGNITSGNANLGNAVIANFFVGSGANLTNINGANVGQVANANYATYTGTALSATTANTVTTNAQPNITSVGTLTSLTVTGNTTLGNIGNVHINGGSNGQYLSTDGTGNLSWATGQSPDSNANAVQFNISGTFTGTPAFTFNNATNTLAVTYVTGTLTTASQPNITSVGNLSSLTVTGNITSGNANLGNAVIANFFVGSGANLANLPAANLVGAVPSANTANTVIVNSQPNITSLGTLTSLDVSGNANIGNIDSVDIINANYFYGDGSNITNLDGNAISGTAANANYSAYAGYVTGAQQTAITKVGNLTSLIVEPTSINNSIDSLIIDGYTPTTGASALNIFLSTDTTGFSILDKPGHTGSGLIVFDALVGLAPFKGAGLGTPNIANANVTDVIVMAKNDTTAPNSHSLIPVSDLKTNLGDSNDEALGERFFRNAYLASVVIKDTSDTDPNNWPAASNWQIIAGSAGLYITDGTGVYPIQVGPDEAGNFGVPVPIPR